MTFRRELVVLAPCKEICEGMKGLLAPGSKFRQRCRMRDFPFNPQTTGPDADMVESEQGDGDVHRYADRLLGSFKPTHRRAIICVDQQFGGDQPAAQTSADVVALMTNDGWSRERFEVIVFDPDSEVWFWQWNNTNVESILKSYSRHRRIRDDQRATTEIYGVIRERNLWPDGQSKPSDPKAAFEMACGHYEVKKSAGIFKSLAERVSDKGCCDEGYLLFKQTMIQWFGPRDVEAQS